MSGRIEHWIGGRPAAGANGAFGDVFDPATGAVRARVPLAGAADVDAAVAAAARAFPAWAATPPLRRARVMFRFRDLVEANLKELAAIVTGEHGKILSDAEGSVIRGLEVVEFAAGIPHLLKGEFTEEVGGGIDSWSTRQPLGVCAGITPFNFPAMVPMWMFPVAIACGNAFVLKPSERDPSCAVRLAELLKEAGLPDCVFNVVHGGKEAVDALLAHEDVAAVRLRRLDADRRIRPPDRRRRRRKRVQALGRGQEPHGGDARRRHGAGDGRADGRRLRLGGRALHGGLRRGRGGRGGRRADGAARAPGCARSASAPEPIPTARWGRWSPPRTRRKWRAISTAASPRARNWRWTGAASSCRATRTGSTLAARCSTMWTPACRSTGRRFSARSSRWCGARDYGEAAGMVNAHEFGNGAAIFTRDGDAARDFANRVNIGMVGVNVPIPVPLAFHSFGGLETLDVSATTTCTGRRACASTAATRW